MVRITHPFHPSKGKVYEYLGRVKYEHADCVKCIDEHGKIKVFPITYTNLYASDETLMGDGCVMSVRDLLSLKEIIDDILYYRKM